MTRYHIYYRQFNILARTDIPYIRVVETDDIYHEIGKMICNALEKIESISYTQSKASQEDCEKLWTERGYRKLTPRYLDNGFSAKIKRFKPYEAERKLK